MRIEKVKFLFIMFFCAGFLFAQLSDGFLDREISDVELGENLIILGSKSGINWKYGAGDEWQNVKHIPFWADSGVIWDNAVAGENGNFVVRLNIQNGNRIAFYDKNTDTVIDTAISNVNSTTQLFGYDAGFFDETDDKYYFSAGDAGIAVLSDGKLEIIETDFKVNSISNNYRNNKFIAISDSGVIYNNNLNSIATLELDKENAEEPIMFINDISDTSILILTVNKNDLMKLYRWTPGVRTTLYSGEISKVITTAITQKYIYILKNDGKLVVLNENGTPNETHRKTIEDNLKKTNVSQNYTLTDISVYGNSLAIATDKGLFYSENGGNSFEFFPKENALKSGLKEVYAEPGIITPKENENFCTFEYSITEEDRVTIDIFNYNLDFVCRIVENGLRPAATADKRSTDRQFDRWDGTINNRGGRTATAGVYYFKITTQKTNKTAFGKVVVAK